MYTHLFSVPGSLPYGSKPNYSEYGKNGDKRNFPNSGKHRGACTSKKDAAKKLSHREYKDSIVVSNKTTSGNTDIM